jgi:DNA repair photolyase
MSKLGYYSSPRITSEFADCSLPITFDDKSNCGFNCAYCFSQYIRGVGPSKTNYDDKNIKTVSIENVKKIFIGKTKTGYSEWIKAKKPIQWGGLSDPFCHLEKKLGTTLELLKFFNEIEYPISFSSKGDLPISDKRYFEEFKKAGDRWHFKGSIITLDDKASRLIEMGTPTPKRRIEVLERLHKECGTLTTWRMRPWVVGVTEKSLPEIIKTAKRIGCQSITTEFYCLDTRAFGRKESIENYKRISKAMNYSVLKFYKTNGTGSGYLRLDYEFLKPLVNEYIRLCKEVGLPYFISDAKHKEKGCGGSCCGLLPNNKHFSGYAKSQMSNMIYIAKEKGTLTLDDVLSLSDKAEESFRKNTKIEKYMNIGNKRSKVKNMSYHDYFIRLWNNGFFERYFEGLLKVSGKDRSGNVVYFFNYKKAKL